MYSTEFAEPELDFDCPKNLGLIADERFGGLLEAMFLKLSQFGKDVGELSSNITTSFEEAKKVVTTLHT